MTRKQWAQQHLDQLKEIYYDSVGYDPEDEDFVPFNMESFVQTVGKFTAHWEQVQRYLDEPAEEGVWPSGKAEVSKASTGGSNPSTPDYD